MLTVPITRAGIILSMALKKNKENVSSQEGLRPSTRRKTVNRRLLDYYPTASTPKVSRKVTIFFANFIIWLYCYKQFAFRGNQENAKGFQYCKCAKRQKHFNSFAQ